MYIVYNNTSSSVRLRFFSLLYRVVTERLNEHKTKITFTDTCL